MLLDAYESDLPWLRFGQRVEFTTESYPGEIFVGQVAFIDPVLNRDTRTVKVRVNVVNDDGRLKPEMFVRATVKSQVASGGRVLDPSLAGKWISPMHPEIVKDEPGVCDICGMPLVRAETLGYVTAEPNEGAKPLVIPASAALLTGKRAIVYVQVPDAEKPTYEGRGRAWASRWRLLPGSSRPEGRRTGCIAGQLQARQRASDFCQTIHDDSRRRRGRWTSSRSYTNDLDR